MFDKHYKEGKAHLENARKQKSDGNLKDAVDSYQKAIKEFTSQGSSLFHDVKRRLAGVYSECGDVYKDLGEVDNADTCYKEAQKYKPKYRDSLLKPETLKNNNSTSSIGSTASSFLPKLELPKPKFFTQDPPVTFQPRSKIDDVQNTQDLAYYLQPKNHTQEQAPQLMKLALEIIELFAQKSSKSKEMVYEVILLASIPNKEIYEELLEQSVTLVNSAILQHSKHELCLSEVIKNVPDSLLSTGGVSTGNLVSVLKILYKRLDDLHKQDVEQLCELLETICPLLDAMVRVGVKGINRETLQVPLYKQLNSLKDIPALAYHASYASQALLHIPNDETLWQEVLRRTFKIVSGVVTIASAVKELEPSKLLDAYEDFSNAFEVFDGIVDGIQELIETGKSIQEGIEGIQEGTEFQHKRQWYLALRFIDIFIQENQLTKLEQFVLQCTYNNKDKWFLIGLCQRLGQIAYTQQDSNVQQGAIKFLGDIYQNESQWGGHPEVKKWALTILQLLKKKDDENLQIYSKEILEKIVNEDTQASDVYTFHIWNFAKPSDLSSRLLAEARRKLSQSLASNATESRAQFVKIKEEYSNNFGQDEEIKNSLDFYVPPKGKCSLNSTDFFDLENEVNTFLMSEKKVLLLLGEAGSGKSTFNHHLTQRLWTDYSSKDNLDNKPVPLYISLPSIENPNGKIIQKHLKDMDFSEEHIENFKKNCKFVFIMDGYNEIRDRQSNFYDKNKLHEWNAKVIISCRPEYLSTKYLQKFTHNNNPKNFQEIWMAPFSKEEIREYIQKHVEKQKDVTEYYENSLKCIPHLDHLLSNPFILKTAVDHMNQYKNENSEKSMNLLTLYNTFVEKWFERSRDHLDRIQLEEDEYSIFESFEYDFVQHFIQFNKDLAVEMFKANEVVVEYSDADDESWRTKFFGYKNPKIRLLRYNSPLSRNGNKYQFIHKSLFEYFVARAIYEAICKDARSALFEENPIPREPGIVQFLIEYVQQGQSSEETQQAEKFKGILCDFIEKSKNDTNFEIAAENATTILNKAGVIGEQE